jgi:cytochrome c oxidase subunit 2
LVRRKLLIALLAVAYALTTAGLAMAGNGGFGLPPAKSPNAGGISDTYWFIFGFTAAVFVLVEGALVVFIVRFRGRGRPREVEGPQIRGNTRLEIAWTVVPVLILAAIAAFVFYKLPGIKDVPKANAARGDIHVKIDAHQFYWNFTYPNGVIAVDNLRAPVGGVVSYDVGTSDVAHSWWIPELGGKIDAIPGKTNHSWFQAQDTGTYQGQCAELCGLFHANMLATVQVLPKQQFEQWLSSEQDAQAAGTSDLGQQTFQGVCAKCHGPQGKGGYGPALTGNPLLTNKQGLEDVIRNGTGKMPAVGNDWTDRQMNALIQYVQKNIATETTGGS